MNTETTNESSKLKQGTENESTKKSEKFNLNIPGFSLKYEEELVGLELPFFSCEIGVHRVIAASKTISRLSKNIVLKIHTIFESIFKLKRNLLPVMVCLVFLIMIASGLWLTQTKKTDNLIKLIQLLRVGQITDAEKVLKNTMFKSISYHQIMARIYLKTGNIEEAEKEIAQIQKKQSDFYDMNVLKGHLSLAKGLSDSKVHYNQALQNKNLDKWCQAECHFGLAHIELLQNNFVKAIAKFDQAIAIDSFYVLSHTGKGLTLEKQNNFQQATKEYNEALKIIKGKCANCSDNILFKVNKILYESRKQIAECTGECMIQKQIEIEALIQKSRGKSELNMNEKNSNELKNVLFLEFGSEGQVETNLGENAYVSELIAQKISENPKIKRFEPLLISAFMLRLQQSYYQVNSLDFALNMGKFLPIHLVVTGTITRKGKQRYITMKIYENKQLKDELSHKFESTDKNDEQVKQLTKGFVIGS